MSCTPLYGHLRARLRQRADVNTPLLILSTAWALYCVAVSEFTASAGFVLIPVSWLP